MQAELWEACYFFLSKVLLQDFFGVSLRFVLVCEQDVPQLNYFIVLLCKAGFFRLIVKPVSILELNRLDKGFVYPASI